MLGKKWHFQDLRDATLRKSAVFLVLLYPTFEIFAGKNLSTLMYSQCQAQWQICNFLLASFRVFPVKALAASIPKNLKVKLGVIFPRKIIFHIFFLQHMVPVMLEVAELKIISSKIHGWNMNQTPQLHFFLLWLWFFIFLSNHSD